MYPIGWDTWRTKEKETNAESGSSMKPEVARTLRERRYTDTRNRERAKSGSEQAESGRREINRSERGNRERKLGSRNHIILTHTHLTIIFIYTLSINIFIL